MKKLTLFATVAAALLLVGDATAAKPTPTQLQRLAMTRYLAKLRPIVAGTVPPIQDISDTFRNTDLGNPDELDTAANSFDQDADLLAAAVGEMRSVLAPLALRGPHVQLRAGYASIAVALRSTAAGFRTHAGSVTYTQRLTDALSRAGEKISYWRDETIVVLRRLRITVPLWVKQIG